LRNVSAAIQDNLPSLALNFSLPSQKRGFLHETGETWGAFHSTKISGNSGPKLNGTVLTNRKISRKKGPPREVDHFFG